MTNLEFIKTLKSGEEILNFFENNDYGCIQKVRKYGRIIVCSRSIEGLTDVENVKLSSGIKK